MFHRLVYPGATHWDEWHGCSCERMLRATSAAVSAPTASIKRTRREHERRTVIGIRWSLKREVQDAEEEVTRAQRCLDFFHNKILQLEADAAWSPEYLSRLKQSRKRARQRLDRAIGSLEICQEELARRVREDDPRLHAE